MRRASTVVLAILAIALLLLLLALIALWHAFPVIVSSVLVAYHVIAQLCRHPLQATWADVVTAAGLLVGAGMLIVLTRFSRRLVQRAVATHARVEALLARRTTQRPDALRAATALLPPGHDSLDLVDCPAPLAFCHGYLRPRICLSTGLVALLTPKELAAVLQHERHHRCQRDPLKVLLTGSVVHAFFFVPILAELARRYEVVKEFAADTAAVAALGVEPLAGALYKVLSCPLAGPDLQTAAVGDLSVTEQRIDHLLALGTGSVPPLTASQLLISTATVSTVSTPLIMLTVIHVQPLLYACRLA